MERAYSVTEVSRTLGLSKVWVRQACREGRIRSFQPISPNANYRIPESEVVRLSGGMLDV